VQSVPSLVRFIIVLAVLAGLVFAGMVALVTFVQVKPHPMEETVPPGRLK
jgi:hypothetical protein